MVIDNAFCQPHYLNYQLANDPKQRTNCKRKNWREERKEELNYTKEFCSTPLRKYGLRSPDKVLSTSNSYLQLCRVACFVSSSVLLNPLLQFISLLNFSLNSTTWKQTQRGNRPFIFLRRSGFFGIITDGSCSTSMRLSPTGANQTTNPPTKVSLGCVYSDECRAFVNHCRIMAAPQWDVVAEFTVSLLYTKGTF